MNISKKSLLLIFASAVLLSACGTTVTINTDPPNVNAYYQGRDLGQTPVKERMTDFVSTEHVVEFRKGDRFIKKVTLKKEPKWLALIGGLFFFYVPGLWGYGPEGYQFFDLKAEPGSGGPTQASNFTDTVVMKDGTRYANVKAVILEGKVIVTTSDGKAYVFNKSEVDTIKK